MDKLDAAIKFIHTELANGPRSSGQVLDSCRVHGISAPTFRRAYKAIGVLADRHPDGTWHMWLPKGTTPLTEAPALMTPADVKQARLLLNLSQADMGRMLGWHGPYAAQQMWMLEDGRLAVKGIHHRMIHAYMEDYRPLDWPA